MVSLFIISQRYALKAGAWLILTLLYFSFPPVFSNELLVSRSYKVESSWRLGKSLDCYLNNLIWRCELTCGSEIPFVVLPSSYMFIDDSLDEYSASRFMLRLFIYRSVIPINWGIVDVDKRDNCICFSPGVLPDQISVTLWKKLVKGEFESRLQDAKFLFDGLGAMILSWLQIYQWITFEEIAVESLPEHLRLSLAKNPFCTIRRRVESLKRKNA